MAEIHYYIVDTETTGLSSTAHEINEISIIRVKDRVQLTEFIMCDHPETASWDALNITGKTMEDLLSGKPKEEVIDKIDKFLSEDGVPSSHRCFIAHNAAFDRRFIHAMYEKAGRSLPVDLWLCTMALTKLYYKKFNISGSKSLHAACDNLGIKKIATHQHTSKMDTRNTYLLYKALVEDKKIDYIPSIVTAVHILKEEEESCLDTDLLDE